MLPLLAAIIESSETGSAGGALGILAGLGLISYLFTLAVIVVIIAAEWKIFAKAGIPGWHCIIPFLSSYQLWKIVTGKGWMFLLTFIPLVGPFIALYAYYRLGRTFGKGVGFSVGMVILPLIFMPMLAFGDAQYYGPNV